MTAQEADKLLEQFEEILFRKFKDSGDHPSYSKPLRERYKYLREKILKELINNEQN